MNCAVAVQAASDVFVIYGCDKKNKWFIRRLNCDKSHGAYLDIFERNEGREYEVSPHTHPATNIHTEHRTSRFISKLTLLQYADQIRM